MSNQPYKSLLHEMTCTTETVLWNDSCSIEELTYAIEHGAVGATANPVIIGTVLRQEMHLWKDRIPQLIQEMPTATEDEIAWKLMEEISAKGAELLLPAFEASGGRNGRLSFQTDPRYYRNAERIVTIRSARLYSRWHSCTSRHVRAAATICGSPSMASNRSLARNAEGAGASSAASR